MSDLISREDAIKDVETWTAVDEHERHLQKNVIEWLKEFPTAELGTNLAEVGTDCSEFPNNSDAISREAVADAINGIECTRHTTWYEFYQKVMTAVEKLPPIQPKRGRWIGKYPVTSVCSECGFLIHDSKVKAFAYCPNCGADMREVNHESN